MFILSDTDLKFVVESVTPDPREQGRVAEAVRDKPDILDAMIGDPLLVERVLDDEEAVVHISPRLLFTILLRQTRRDLDSQPYINEIGELRGGDPGVRVVSGGGPAGRGAFPGST